jgi:hypothetical protein
MAWHYARAACRGSLSPRLFSSLRPRPGARIWRALCELTRRRPLRTRPQILLRVLCKYQGAIADSEGSGLDGQLGRMPE